MPLQGTNGVQRGEAPWLRGGLRPRVRCGGHSPPYGLPFTRTSSAGMTEERAEGRSSFAGVWGVPRFFLSTPKIGGQGVEMGHEDSGGGFHFAPPALQLWYHCEKRSDEAISGWCDRAGVWIAAPSPHSARRMARNDMMRRALLFATLS